MVFAYFYTNFSFEVTQIFFQFLKI